MLTSRVAETLKGGRAQKLTAGWAWVLFFFPFCPTPIRKSGYQKPLFRMLSSALPIRYDKLLALLAEKGLTSYRIRREKIMGQATLTAIKNGTGGLDHRTIAKLCEVLDCQPGDLMEYVREKDTTDA